MPQTPAHITVDPVGYALSVTLTPPSGTLVLSRRDGSSTYDVVTMPTTITAPTNFWLTNGGIDVSVSLKLDAHEVAADCSAPQVVSLPASGGKAIRPAADALRAASGGLTQAAAAGAYQPIIKKFVDLAAAQAAVTAGTVADGDVVLITGS